MNQHIINIIYFLIIIYIVKLTYYNKYIISFCDFMYLFHFYNILNNKHHFPLYILSSYLYRNYILNMKSYTCYY